MAWIKQKILEFPCATRVCVREGACCRCDAECGDCGCKNCGNRMEFYVLFDGVFPCGIPPENVVDDIDDWLFGEHQGYGEGQVEIGVCGEIFVPMPLMVNVIIDIEGCPSSAQKQIIEDQITALFQRICPSMPLRVKQTRIDRRHCGRCRNQRRGQVRDRGLRERAFRRTARYGLHGSRAAI